MDYKNQLCSKIERFNLFRVYDPGLHLGDGDVLTAPDDEVLAASGDPDRPVRIGAGEIPGIEPAGLDAERDRKVNKRRMRQLWITRINSAARLNGLTYSVFMNTASTSATGMFSPPRMMRSLLRPVIRIDPSALARARSPVSNQPASTPKETEK